MKTITSLVFCIGASKAFLDFNVWSKYVADKTYMKELDEKYSKYMSEYSKSYGTREEYEFRRSLFAEKELQINAWNRMDGKKHVLGHNKFSDWTKHEYQQLLGFKPITEKEIEGETAQELGVSDLPESINWVTKGAVNPVQNQGNCGSCWAFSAVGEMEGAHFVATNKLIKLSEQQCLDCSRGAHGCRGGWQKNCYEYAETQAMESEADYPYTTIVDMCFAYKTPQVMVKSYGIVPAHSVSQLKARLAQQPVAVTIEADQPVFQQYKSGIIDTPYCGTSLDHAVLAVGYGSENGTDYYLVKNSWGTDWGEQGYVRIAAKADGPGVCGIQMYSSYTVTD